MKFSFMKSILVIVFFQTDRVVGEGNRHGRSGTDGGDGGRMVGASR